MTEQNQAPIFMLGGGESGYATCPSCLVNILAMLDRHDDKMAMGTMLTALANVIWLQIPSDEREQFLALLPAAMAAVLAKADATEPLSGPVMGHA